MPVHVTGAWKRVEEISLPSAAFPNVMSFLLQLIKTML